MPGSRKSPIAVSAKTNSKRSRRSAYIDAQEEYAEADRDDDGVLEYAQRLISSEGKADGLYWPERQDVGTSPAGSFVDQSELQKATEDRGYYGYRFKILKRQGANIAGGAYDYTINGNMIAGFGLVALAGDIRRNRHPHLRGQPQRHRLSGGSRRRHG
jgi:hypothetical protein